MELKQHPLSAAFPAMNAEDFRALVDDVKANGQREPIMLLDGMVLDGWHRYRACVELGIKPPSFTFSGMDPVAFVLSHNLHRRHLTPSQRAAAVVACTEYGAQGRPQKRGNVAPFSPAPKVADLAKAAQVAPRLIKDAAVAKKAGLLGEVKDGTISATRAARIARGDPGKPNPTPAPTPAPAPDLAEAREAISILSDENDRLNDRLAVEAMDATEEEKLKAASTITELRAELKTAQAELRAVKASRDHYMRENAELKRTVDSLRRKLKRSDHAVA